MQLASFGLGSAFPPEASEDGGHRDAGDASAEGDGPELGGGCGAHSFKWLRLVKSYHIHVLRMGRGFYVGGVVIGYAEVPSADQKY